MGWVTGEWSQNRADLVFKVAVGLERPRVSVSSLFHDLDVVSREASSCSSQPSYRSTVR